MIMASTRTVLSACLSVLLALGSLPATLSMASAQEFVDGKVESTHGDWQIRCDQPVGARDKQCAMVQNVTAEDRDNIGLSVLIVKTVDKKAKIMRVLAPLDLALGDRPGALVLAGPEGAAHVPEKDLRPAVDVTLHHDARAVSHRTSWGLWFSLSQGHQTTTRHQARTALRLGDRASPGTTSVPNGVTSYRYPNGLIHTSLPGSG